MTDYTMNSEASMRFFFYQTDDGMQSRRGLNPAVEYIPELFASILNADGVDLNADLDQVPRTLKKERSIRNTTAARQRCTRVL